MKQKRENLESCFLICALDLNFYSMTTWGATYTTWFWWWDKPEHSPLSCSRWLNLQCPCCDTVMLTTRSLLRISIRDHQQQSYTLDVHLVMEKQPTVTTFIHWQKWPSTFKQTWMIPDRYDNSGHIKSKIPGFHYSYSTTMVCSLKCCVYAREGVLHFYWNEI